MDSRTWAVRFLLFVTGTLEAQAPPTPSAAPAPTTCSAAEHRQLDFWVGEWDVRGVRQPKDAPPSRSRIESVEGGCVIYEQYSAPSGYSGRSLNAYDPAAKRWEQFWVDNQGGLHHYVGHARDGNMYYEAEGAQFFGMTRPGTVRMTFFDLGSGRVRQFSEASTDGGKTWTALYDLTYTRRK